MARYSDELAVAVQSGVSVFYFASTEQGLLREAAAHLCAELLEKENESETTRIDGPVPDMGEVITAAGTVSFFGTKRVVELREISPSSMGDKDIKELTALFGQLENAVLVVTALYKDKKAATAKKAKDLMGAADKMGFAVELAKPTLRENLAFVKETAEGLEARFEPGVAEALVERVGEDRELLRNEVQKLAAISGYGVITMEMVGRYSVQNVEADVFELARLITTRRKAQAYARLQDLFALKHEPIAICGALAGTFVEMYRVRCGTEQRKTIAEIFKDMGYKGNDYRLKKTKESAAHYTTRQLEECVLMLQRLDSSLKSSAFSDKTVLLEAAVGRLLAIGEGK